MTVKRSSDAHACAHTCLSHGPGARLPCKDYLCGCLYGLLPIGVAFLRAADPTQPDKLRVGVVQNFDRVAIEDGDDRADEGREGS